MNKNIKKHYNIFKKAWHFISRHNAPVIALEIIIFTGVILAFAAEDNGNNELGVTNYGTGNITTSMVVNTPQLTEEIIIEQENSQQEIISSEQIISKNEEIESGVKSHDLIILNPHSYPGEGGIWSVFFETKGVADLIVTPDNQNSIDDLDFMFLKCGQEERSPQTLENDVIFYPQWSCMETGEITHLVNINRAHTLKFQFADQISFAYNSAEMRAVGGYEAINRTTVLVGNYTYMLPDSLITKDCTLKQWTAYTEDAGPWTLKLKIFRVNGGNYDLVGTDTEIVANGFNTFSCDIPVLENDIVGFYIPGASNHIAATSGGSDNDYYKAYEVVGTTAQGDWGSEAFAPVSVQVFEEAYKPVSGGIGISGGGFLQF